MAINNNTQIKGFKPGTSAVDIMNVIREHASEEYKRYVPIASPKNVGDFREMSLQFNTFSNEWAEGLINRIGRTVLVSNNFTNPWAELMDKPLEQGAIEQLIYVSPIEPVPFSLQGGVEDVHKISLPKILAAYLPLTDKVKFPITIQDHEIERAFTSWDSVANLINNTLDRLFYSAAVYEYSRMTQLVQKVYIEGGLTMIEVGDAVNDPKATRDLVKGIKSMLIKSRFPNDNTALGVETTDINDDMYLITSADVQTAIEVDIESAAYNLDKVSYLAKRLTVPEFDDPNLMGMLMSRSFFRFRNDVRDLRIQANGSNMTSNYWYHLQAAFNYSPFAFGVVFVKSIDAALDTRAYLSKPVDIIRADTTRNYSCTYAFHKPKEVTVTSTIIAPTIGQDSDITVIDLEDTPNGFKYKLKASADIFDKSGDGDTYTVKFTLTFEGETIPPKTLTQIIELA